jgi:hypothetical protein
MGGMSPGASAIVGCVWTSTWVVVLPVRVDIVVVVVVVVVTTTCPVSSSTTCPVLVLYARLRSELTPSIFPLFSTGTMSALLRDSGMALLREARFEEGLLLLLAYAESG